jgi:large subunit ribosomal protein L24
MHVRKNDIVIALPGDDRGKKGRVLVASPSEGKVVVEGINYIWRHVRRSKKAPAGGRLQKEAPLDASKVALFCPRCNRGVRIAHKETEKGDKIRVCVRCKEGV